jgi:Flp pilus assembly secretin CpaC
MAMAGLIAEQTKQAVNGLPGLSQLPVLGTLFRSRDFVNNQTELMVLVTPYVVRAVAQKDLVAADDGFAAASTRRPTCSATSIASTAFRAVSRRPGIIAAPTALLRTEAGR